MSRRDDDHGIPKARLDALVDAVFGVAMTLLVIGIALPDSFQPKSNRQLTDAVIDLHPQLLVYVITFFVVGLRWLGATRLAAGLDYVSYDYAKLMLLNLFLISCLPFSTMLIGRYGDFFVAATVYAGNTILSALVTMWLDVKAAQESGHPRGWRDFDIGLPLLIATAVLSVVVALFSPAHAMIPYVLNVARPLLGQPAWARPHRGSRKP